MTRGKVLVRLFEKKSEWEKSLPRQSSGQSRWRPPWSRFFLKSRRVRERRKASKKSARYIWRL